MLTYKISFFNNCYENIANEKEFTFDEIYNRVIETINGEVIW